VYDTNKKKVGDIDLSDDVFGAEVRPHLFWETVKWQQARKRAGTHKTKGRSEVSGTGKKPYRQKGTGNARRGTMRAPNHVGGGTQFGPQPRDYSYPLNKKVRQAALKSALSLRAGAEGGLIVLDKFQLDAPKTKAVSTALGKFGIGKALIIDADNKNLSLSARNLPSAKFLPAAGLNVYDVLRYDTLILTKAGAEAVTERLTR
jgi:large subunit ribosomal protein L4